MSKKDFYWGCPNCPEPATTLEYGEHVFIHVTAVQHGINCLVAMTCSVCGDVQDISRKVDQSSYQNLLDMLEKRVALKKDLKEKGCIQTMGDSLRTAQETMENEGLIDEKDVNLLSKFLNISEED